MATRKSTAAVESITIPAAQATKKPAAKPKAAAATKTSKTSNTAVVAKPAGLPVTKKAAVTKTASAKPAAKTTTPKVKTVATASTNVSAKPAVAKSKAAPRSPAKITKTSPPRPAVSAEQRRHYVEVAAFHIAERRGFAPGDSTTDWLAAEAEIDRLIASGHIGG